MVVRSGLAWVALAWVQPPPTLEGAKQGLGLEGATWGLRLAKHAWPLFCPTWASAQTSLQHHVHCGLELQSKVKHQLVMKKR
jgi:hypothetical protein